MDYTAQPNNEFIKDVKHQFRKFGYGRLNILSTTENCVIVEFRQTDRTYVNERRSDLLNEIAEKSHVFFEGFVVSIAVEDLLERKVKKQQKRIDILEEKLERCVSVVHQLLGGLYNQTTQKNTLDGYISILFNQPKSIALEDTDSDWPTTRQGDDTNVKLDQLIEELRIRIPDIEI
jgi:hypothetical protein